MNIFFFIAQGCLLQLLSLAPTTGKKSYKILELGCITIVRRIVIDCLIFYLEQTRKVTTSSYYRILSRLLDLIEPERAMHHVILLV